MTYWQQMLDRRWKEFSDHYKEVREWICHDCGSRHSGFMETHHMLYRAHLLLWQYPFEDLLCLCRKCHYARTVNKKARDFVEARHFAKLPRAYETEYILDSILNTKMPLAMTAAWKPDCPVILSPTLAITFSLMRICFIVEDGWLVFDEPPIKFVDKEINDFCSLLEQERFERFIRLGLEELSRDGVTSIGPNQIDDQSPNGPWLMIEAPDDQFELALSSISQIQLPGPGL